MFRHISTFPFVIIRFVNQRKGGKSMNVVKLHDKDSRVVGNVTGQITISIYNGEFKGHPNFLIQADHSVSEIADIIEDVLYSY